MHSLFFGLGILYVNALFTKWTMGRTGLIGITPLFETTSKVPYYYFFLVVAILSLAILYRFEFSRIGITLKAVDQSHMVASSVGINESRYRVLSLVVGSFFIGIIGGVVGVVLGLAGVVGLEYILPFSPAPSLTLIVGAFALAVVLSVLGGLYPAWKAARLDPVVAIRAE